MTTPAGGLAAAERRIYNEGVNNAGIPANHQEVYYG